MMVILHHLDENGDNWSQMNKKTNFFQMGIADLRRFLRESANSFLNLCSEFGNSIKGKSIMTRVISDYGSEKKN